MLHMLTTLPDNLLLRHDVCLRTAEHLLHTDSMCSLCKVIQGNCICKLKKSSVSYLSLKHIPNESDFLKKYSINASAKLATLHSNQTSYIDNNASKSFTGGLILNQHLSQSSSEFSSIMEEQRKIHSASSSIQKKFSTEISFYNAICEKLEDDCINVKNENVSESCSVSGKGTLSQGNTNNFSSYALSTTTDRCGDALSVETETENAISSLSSSAVFVNPNSNKINHFLNGQVSQSSLLSNPYNSFTNVCVSKNDSNNCLSVKTVNSNTSNPQLMRELITEAPILHLLQQEPRNECLQKYSAVKSCTVSSENYQVFDYTKFALSHANSEGCFRGELLLSDEEYEILHRALQLLENSCHWRFEEVVEHGRKKNKKGNQAGAKRLMDVYSVENTAYSIVGKYGRGSKSEEFDEQSHTTQTSYDKSVVSQAQYVVPTDSLEYSKKYYRKRNVTGSVNSIIKPGNFFGNNTLLDFPEFCRPPPPPAVLDRMPEWIKCLHRAIFELCSTPHCLPFVSDVLLGLPRYEECLNSINPRTPTCLQNILDNLENCVYADSSQVISEVYSILTCAFRFYEPGSNIWMRAHQSSVFFQRILQNEFFNGFAVEADNTYAPVGKVDDLLKRMVSNGREKKRKGGNSVLVRKHKAPRMKTQSETGKYSKTNTKKSGNSVKVSKNKAVTDAERSEFQNLLANLPQSHHFELFNTFQHKAVWRTLEGGEVELDEQGTSPYMFREMVSWCKAQFATSLSNNVAYSLSGVKYFCQGQDEINNYNQEQELSHYSVSKRKKQLDMVGGYSSNSSSDASDVEV